MTKMILNWMMMIMSVKRFITWLTSWNHMNTKHYWVTKMYLCKMWFCGDTKKSDIDIIWAWSIREWWKCLCAKYDFAVWQKECYWQHVQDVHEALASDKNVLVLYVILQWYKKNVIYIIWNRSWIISRQGKCP